MRLNFEVYGAEADEMGLTRTVLATLLHRFLFLDKLQ